MSCRTSQPFLFFFNDTATTEIYTLSLHDALPILARLVRQGEADALVSAGNTGALMTVARFVLGTLPSVQRPALAAPFPTSRGGVAVLIDAGANVDSKVGHLLQFALMGEIYYRVIF